MSVFDDDVPTFGFREVNFTPKASCACCGRKVYVGLVNIAHMDRSDEYFKVVCRRCGNRWDHEAKEEE